MVRQGDTIRGVLPLVWQRSRIFGSFLTSLPYFNYGGIIAEGHEAEQALLREAIALARQLRATHLELRHRRDHTLGLPLKTNKVSVICEVQTDAERMWQSLPHKVPTDIRKPMKSGLTAEFGGAELLNEFYSVFAENMRDLGTPVYSKKFFAEILRTFPEDSYICLTRHDGSPAAASFLLGYRNTLEVPWSSSLRRYRSMKPNMLLYWKSLCFAGERGYQIFDFGLSSIG